jgi:anti-sigma factor RsiW
MNAMSCQDVLDRVAAYLDSELGPTERELLERHLDGCPSCSATFEKIAAQELRPPPVSDAVAARVGASDFWAPMDARLASELTVQMNAPSARAPRIVAVSWKVAIAYAATLAVALLWGAHSHRQVLIARAEAESLSRQLERAERLADSPQGAAPSAPIQAPAVPGHASSDLELAGYTPHRGTF